MSMLAAYLINWGCNPFSKRLTGFIKKSKEFNLSDIGSDITGLTLTLSINGPKGHLLFYGHLHKYIGISNTSIIRPFTSNNLNYLQGWRIRHVAADW